jgi:hypothetical protein
MLFMEKEVFHEEICFPFLLIRLFETFEDIKGACCSFYFDVLVYLS